jgi:lysosomal acid lipase/cholesteryl ester hydrolase
MFSEYIVKTDDGYFLTLHRVWLEMPEFQGDRPVVLLQHGMLSSSEVWLLNEGKSVAFKLAKEGYDVWMGNNRGNVYSRGHERLNAKGDSAEKKEYFDFSFYEMGKYDLPAMVERVLEVSGADQLSYMGHS